MEAVETSIESIKRDHEVDDEVVVMRTKGITRKSAKSEDRQRLSIGAKTKRKLIAGESMQLESIDHAKQMAKLLEIIDKTDQAISFGDKE
jgi:hypothetical protein